VVQPGLCGLSMQTAPAKYEAKNIPVGSKFYIQYKYKELWYFIDS
jgi:hypothetical protein